ncbi:flagellar biosynthesis protein FliR [Salipiger pallidus]|uniref:Flagellar biosynthesis protein FliR n=1 Tax=Salipiger pallidus TaxID=1775170 RepID=A0A8J3EI05_9RHOB|nr:flagellar biosynthetic protein FliR [Salipiger pallidus]GGG78551.1 flagellar biosynthesis protein FliR [Salipiger pallidus]
MSFLPELIEEGSALLWLAAVVFFRVVAMVSFLPGFGEQVVSARVRVVIGFMLTVAILPATAELITPPDSLPQLLLAILTESVNGLVLGIWLRLIIHGLQVAGSIAAQSTSLAQLLGNSGADPMPAIGHLLNVSALALLMLSGFHAKVASFLILSYDLLPALSFPDPAAIAEAGRTQVTRSFALAFTLAAPFVVLSVLYNLTLGFINKAMPQLMVAFVGAPVITLGALGLLFLSAPVMLAVWLSRMDAFLSNPGW